MSEAIRDKPWIIRTYAGHSTAADSNRLFRSNLAKVLGRVRDEALRRDPLTVEVARGWHRGIMEGLVSPDPELVGRFEAWLP